MTRNEFVTEMDQLLKLVRTEYALTQDTMALALGISKKTLVQVEKERSSLGWTGAVALACIFSGSRILSDHWGGECGDIIQALAFQDIRPHWPRTMGGKIWWRTVENMGPYRIQQNILSHHYRALDPSDGRICSSFELETIHQRLQELTDNPSK